MRTEIIFVLESWWPEAQRAIRSAKPPAYPRQGREAWKPAQGIPRRMSKGEATVNLVRRIAEQEAGLREWMDAMRRGDHRHAG